MFDHKIFWRWFIILSVAACIGLAMIIFVNFWQIRIIQNQIKETQTQPAKRHQKEEFYMPPSVATTTPVQVEDRGEPEILPGDRQTRVPILMYHYVRKIDGTLSPSGQKLSVSPSHFENQIKTLKSAGYNFITLDDLAAYLDEAKPLPPKPVILTFDDGYRDFYTDVFPILKKYRIPAASFLIINGIGRPYYVTWPMVQEMSKSGLVTFGSHTLNHAPLARLPLDRAASEISESKKILEQKLGKPVKYFCYPYGFYNEAVVNLVRETGYDLALTIHSGILHTTSSRLELRRVRVNNNDVGYQLLEKLKRIKKVP